MGFNQIRLGVEEIFTIIVQDETGRTIDKWVTLKSDFTKVLRILNNKFGLNIWKKKDKDLEWAMH